MIDQQFIAQARHIDRTWRMTKALQSEALRSGACRCQQGAARQLVGEALGGEKTFARVHVDPAPS